MLSGSLDYLNKLLLSQEELFLHEQFSIRRDSDSLLPPPSPEMLQPTYDKYLEIFSSETSSPTLQSPVEQYEPESVSEPAKKRQRKEATRKRQQQKDRERSSALTEKLKNKEPLTDIDEKTLARREKNKKSAQASRNRKATYIKQLETTLASLTSELESVRVEKEALVTLHDNKYREINEQLTIAVKCNMQLSQENMRLREQLNQAISQPLSASAASAIALKFKYWK